MGRGGGGCCGWDEARGGGCGECGGAAEEAEDVTADAAEETAGSPTKKGKKGRSTSKGKGTKKKEEDPDMVKVVGTKENPKKKNGWLLADTVEVPAALLEMIE